MSQTEFRFAKSAKSLLKVFNELKHFLTHLLYSFDTFYTFYVF